MRQLTIGIAVLASIGASLLLGGCGSGAKSYAPVATTKGTYTITITDDMGKRSVTRDSSADQTVWYPDSAYYVVTVSSTDGFVGTINLAQSGLQVGDNYFHVGFDTSTVTLTSTTTSVSRTLTVTPYGEGISIDTRNPFTVTGTSGNVTVSSNQAGITVRALD